MGPNENDYELLLKLAKTMEVAPLYTFS